MKKRRKNIVYSTNPNFKYDYDEEMENTIAKNKQNQPPTEGTTVRVV